MVTINKLGEVAKKIAHKELGTKNIPGPTGVRGRNSDNDLIKEKIAMAA